jgi:hypothetical protein
MCSNKNKSNSGDEKVLTLFPVGNTARARALATTHFRVTAHKIAWRKN